MASGGSMLPILKIDGPQVEWLSAKLVWPLVEIVLIRIGPWNKPILHRIGWRENLHKTPSIGGYNKAFL